MELKNKIDWQVKNLQECGLTIKANQRMNAFEVTALDTTNFSYYLTNKEPKIFENTTKSGKKIKVLAWMFDNMTHWVKIPAYKKIISGKFFLIALDHKFTKAELIKELDECALGFDDFMIANLNNIDYILADTYTKDYTKLQDAIAKNNDQLTEEQKIDVLKENKEKRIALKKDREEKHFNMLKYKKEHNIIATDEVKELEKFEKIKNIRKEELIKKINDLQNLAIEKLNSEEIVNHLETEDKLTITEIEAYIDRIIDQHFEKPFLTNSLIIYLVKGISLIAKTRTLTLEARNLKVDNYLLDKYNESVAINDIDVNDECDECDETLDNEEFCTDEVIIQELKKCFHIGKKVNLNKVLLNLDYKGINNTDIWNVTAIIQNNELEDDTVYNDEGQLVTAIEIIYKNNLNSNFNK